VGSGRTATPPAALRFAIERGYDEIVAIIHQEELRRRGLTRRLRHMRSTGAEEAMWSGDQERVIALLEADPTLVQRVIRMAGWCCTGRRGCSMNTLWHGCWSTARTERAAKGQWTPLDFAASGRCGRERRSGAIRVHAKTLLRGGAAPSSISAVALGDVDSGRPAAIRRSCAWRSPIDWPRDDPRWYWKLQDPLCFWNHMPAFRPQIPEFDRGTYLTCFGWCWNAATPMSS